jgi:hypothetical protein
MEKLQGLSTKLSGLLLELPTLSLLSQRARFLSDIDMTLTAPHVLLAPDSVVLIDIVCVPKAVNALCVDWLG